MGVITKPSSVQRSGIVRLLGSYGMAAGCGGDHSQRAPRGAVYRRHGLLPRAPHALQQTQAVHKKRAVFCVSCLTYNAGAFHIGPYAKLLRYGTLATSSYDQHLCSPFDQRNSFLYLAARLPVSPSGFRTTLALHCHAG